MRLTEQEFLDLMAKKKVTRIILPVPLPTWNALLAMGWRDRKKARNAVHQIVSLAVSTYIANGSALQTQTVFRLKQPLTEYAESEYLKMITPRSSRKYRNRKKKQKETKQS